MIEVRRAARSDARAMAMMRYAFRTGLAAPAESEPAESSPELRLAAEPVSLPVTRLGP